MSGVKWIKLHVGMFEDEKIDFIQSLPEANAILVIWIRLLTIAGKCNSGGWIFLTEDIPYTEEMLAHKFRQPLSIIKLALETFQRLNMIEINQRGIFLCNWDKHQSVEEMAKMRDRELARERKRRQREREKEQGQKLLGSGENQEVDTGHENVTRDKNVTLPQNHALELDIDIDKEIDINNIYSIFEHWNSCKIVQHRNLDDKSKRAVKTALKTHSVTEIRQAITNYSHILQSGEYIWSHKWTLREFLQRGLDKFVDWETCSQNYRADRWRKSQQPTGSGQEEVKYKHQRKVDYSKYLENGPPKDEKAKDGYKRRRD